MRILATPRLDGGISAHEASKEAVSYAEGAAYGEVSGERCGCKGEGEGEISAHISGWGYG